MELSKPREKEREREREREREKERERERLALDQRVLKGRGPGRRCYELF